ncbi:MAG: protease HtpX [Pseudomonadota bacterium]
MLRLALFVGTNLAVVFVLNLIITLLGLNQGTSWLPFLLMAGVMGMAGSFISLMMSKSMAKRSMGAQVIEEPSSETERWLVDTVRRQAEAAGIGMPEVAIFQSPTPNAFATGAKKHAALVAVSTGLLQHMNRDEVEAVLGHEVAHVANGDMVTLALVQGVLNTFVMVIARLISSIVDGRRGGRHYGYSMTYMLAQTVLGFLATIVVRWFSRYREFRADEGGASLSSREKMISALERLQGGGPSEPLPGQLRAFGISGGMLGNLGGLKRLFMTHPPLEERIAALRAGV